MKKHNYIPLCTFRGYEGKLKVIGTNNVMKPELIDGTIHIPLGTFWFLVAEGKINPDTVGTYTGKDDKNGTPIFCGVNGAKYGSDYLDFGNSNYSKDKRIVEFSDYASCFTHTSSSFKDVSKSVVSGSQWEEHLKEETK